MQYFIRNYSVQIIYSVNDLLQVFVSNIHIRYEDTVCYYFSFTVTLCGEVM